MAVTLTRQLTLDMVPVDRDLLLAVRAALAQTFTKRGHVAQRVEHEGLGYCSATRGCGRTCLDQKALFLELDALVGDGEAAP